MALTYQPFAHVPTVNEPSAEFAKNISDQERTISTLAGATLLGAAFAGSGVTRWLCLAGGAILLGRGISGHCPIYKACDIDARKPREAVDEGAGTKVEARVQIRCGTKELFQFWRALENLPRVMSHVESVKQLDRQRSHWKVKVIGGVLVEWDAEIIHEEQGKMLAWKSSEGASVKNAGSVWFESIDDQTTEVKVALAIEPLGGKLGLMLADLLGENPEQMLREDLERFKIYAERDLATVVGQRV